MTERLTVSSLSGVVTTQDRGRRGLASIGVGASGAADRESHDRANRLVGNVEDAATLEITFGSLRLQATTHAWIAVTGAAAAVTLGGEGVPMDTRIALPPGRPLEIGRPDAGLRTYLAVRGGIGVEPVLGSRSTDTLSGLGPPRVEPGADLAIGTDRGEFPSAEFAIDRFVPESVLRLPVQLGPRDDWFTAVALTRLRTATWTVGADSDRIGVRLEGPPLERRIHRELPSEGMVLGSVQVPPAGPIVFLDDHPVTGGYPVIGVVDRAAVNRLAQARPGQRVRFDAPATLPSPPDRRPRRRT